MKRFSAAALLAIVAASVSVMFVEDRWASALPEASACLLAALWALYFSGRPVRPATALPLWVFLFVAALGFIQILFGLTVYKWQTSLSVLYWLGNLAVLFSSMQSFSDDRVRQNFLRRLALFGFAIAVISSLQALTSDAKVYWTFQTKFRGWVVMGPFVYHNQYAAFIELLLPIALFSALTDRSWRWIWLLISATMYASVFISGSRAGFILTTLELILVPLATVRVRKTPVLAVAGSAAILTAMVALLAFAAGPEYLLARFHTSDPYAIRREFVQSSIRMFRDHPLIGVGLGNWPTAYPGYALFDDGLYANQAHNDWAQWAVEGGIPMIAGMLTVAFWVFRRAVRSAWGLGTAAIFLHCFVDYPLQRPAVAVVFFSIVAALPASHRRVRKRGSERALEGDTVRSSV